MLAALAAAAALAAPPITDLARDLTTPGWEQRYSFAEAVLIASGADTPPELARWATRFDDLLADLEAAVRADARFPAASGERRAELLVSAMHAGPLQTYDAGASDLRALLATRRFNCLSASVVFLLAAQRLALIALPYVTQGHVLAVVFTAEGPRFVETTNPAIPASSTWDMPLQEYYQTANAAQAASEGTQRRLLAEAAERQLVGDDGGAEQALAALRAVQEAIGAYAEQRRRELEESAFEVALPNVLALIYWNRAFAAVREGRTEQAAWAFSMQAALGSGAWLGRTLGLRSNQLRDLIGSIGRQAGWPAACKTLDGFLAIVRDERERMAVRDLRAQILAHLVLDAPAEKRCAELAKAARVDPAHPLIALLTEKSAAFGCSG